MNKTNRALLIGGVEVASGRLIRPSQIMVEICDELEDVVRRMLDGTTHFKTISLILRFVDHPADKLEMRVSERYSELQVTTEIPIREVHLKKHDVAKPIFMRATLRALAASGARYELPIDEINQLILVSPEGAS